MHVLEVRLCLQIYPILVYWDKTYTYGSDTQRRRFSDGCIVAVALRKGKYFRVVYGNSYPYFLREHAQIFSQFDIQGQAETW